MFSTVFGDTSLWDVMQSVPNHQPTRQQAVPKLRLRLTGRHGVITRRSAFTVR